MNEPHSGDISMLNVCRVKALAKGGAIQVLRGVDLQIDAGEYLGVIGASGSGKSTMLRLLNRLEDPDEGTIRYGGVDLNSLPIIEVRRKIGLVMQKPVIFPGSVIENVLMHDIIAGRIGDEEKGCRWLEFVRLPRDMNCRDATALSVGQQARVQLARTLYLEPEVIMLDECTANLDARNADEILDNLEKLFPKRKRTIIHVSHQRSRLQRCRRLIYLEDGLVAASGAPEHILNDPGSPARKVLTGSGEAAQ